MASSNASPATFRDEETATSFMDSTATSVVPPPISTTIWPFGPEISSPAPRAAARGSSIRYTRRAPASMAALMTARSSTSVIPLGTQTITLGFTRACFTAWRKKCSSIRSVIS